MTENITGPLSTPWENFFCKKSKNLILKSLLLLPLEVYSSENLSAVKVSDGFTERM